MNAKGPVEDMAVKPTLTVSPSIMLSWFVTRNVITGGPPGGVRSMLISGRL